MKVKKVKLQDFRNHAEINLDLSDTKTLIIGPNGSGKTNILEALNILSTGKSFRADYLRDVIKFERDFSRIESEIEIENDDTYSLEMLIIKSTIYENASSKKVKVNKVVKSLQKFTDITKTILFTPEDIQLLTGAPSERRRFLDNLLSQVSREYKKAHSNLAKIIRQRNKLLEIILETGKGRDQMEYWNRELMVNASIIHKYRKEFFSFLDTQLKMYGHFLESSDISLETTYSPNEVTEERLKSYSDKELYAQTTLLGPQRDDFYILRNSHNISKYGSRGQQRTAILGLKLSEIDYVEKITGIKPVLLLDDIFSELDQKHKENVLSTIETHQTIITSAEDIPDLKAKIIRI